MPYIDVRVNFSDVYDKEEDYTDYSPVSVQQIGTDLDDGAVEIIGEAAGQSDTYTVDVSNAFLLALGEKGSVFPVRR